MEQQVNSGDVVQLVSGGPKMTVVYSSNYEVKVIWFDIDNRLQEAKMALHLVRLTTAGV